MKTSILCYFFFSLSDSIAIFLMSFWFILVICKVSLVLFCFPIILFPLYSVSRNNRLLQFRVQSCFSGWWLFLSLGMLSPSPNPVRSVHEPSQPLLLCCHLCPSIPILTHLKNWVVFHRATMWPTQQGWGTQQQKSSPSQQASIPTSPGSLNRSGIIVPALV